MTQTSRHWGIGLILAASSWLVTVVILIVALVRFQLDRSPGLSDSSFWLALVAGVIAVVTAAFALRGLRRQQAIEWELRRQQATFRGILTIAADAIITVDSDQRIVHFNNGAEQLFGYSEDEIRGEPLDKLIPSRFRASHEAHVERFGHDPDVARRMGERRAIFGLRKGGTEFRAEASISKLDVEGVRLFSVVLRDITSRLQAEERQRFLARASSDLAASLEYEAALVAACHCGVPYLADCALLDILAPVSGEVRRVASVHDDTESTRVLKRLEGRSAAAPHAPFPVAEVVASGTPVLRVGLEPGWTQALGSDVPRGQDLESLGVRAFITAPLRARDRVFGTLTLIATDPARPCGVEECGVAEALADRVAVAIDNAWLYREARRASQAREELLGVVSHDLRNPLSAISMCARVLFEQPPADPADHRELTGAILDSVAMMQRLIQDLLDVATIESGHLRVAVERADMADIARRAMGMVRQQADERGVSLQLSLPAGLPPIRVDAVRIEQVIANLLANAVKFTDAGGEVTLDVAARGPVLQLNVHDTGIGIPEDFLPHLFDRFWHSNRSGRTAGTGLGLAITKGIVAAHGGTIEVTSVVGRGSTFSIALPVVDEVHAAPSPPATASAGTHLHA